MPRLNLAIVEHHINTWLNSIPVRQKKIPINPSKHEAINFGIDKLKHVGFIYPIVYTTWAFNPIPILNKQGTIHVCTYFCDLNIACPKGNFPTPFVDRVSDECAGHEVLFVMDGFSRNNKICIHYSDQLKTSLTIPWGKVDYQVMPSSLNNDGATLPPCR